MRGHFSACVLQWNHAHVSGEILAMPDRDPLLGLASMEPRSCKRGNYVPCCKVRRRGMLQWNHAHVSVEIPTTADVHPDEVELQWNHAHVSVEIRPEPGEAEAA